jgi:hypothetical protein
MNLWRRLLPILVPALVLAVAVFVSCNKDDNKDDGGSGDEDIPRSYDPTMVGWAFGDATYEYLGGKWRVVADNPFAVTIRGAAFVNRYLGYVHSSDRIYWYSNGNWSSVSPAGVPPNLQYVRGVVGPDQGGWFVGNTPDYAGYIVRVGPDGAATLWAAQGTLSPSAVFFVNAFVVPGDAALHFATVIDGWYQHVRWDGVNVQAETLFQVQWIQPGADDDDDTSPGADDDVSPSPPVPFAQVYDLAATVDGQYWAVGYDYQDGIKRGVFWRRDDASVYTRVLPNSVTECQTESVRKLYFTADGGGFAIAECTWSQIYQLQGGGWTEMQIPGVKDEQFAVSDMSLINQNRGWVVGYAPDLSEPLLMLRDANGFTQAQFAEGNQGDHLYAVAIFEIYPYGVDDDDTSPDDDSPDDDTAVDDDTSPVAG